MQNETILLVEDDDNDVLLLQRAFAKAGLRAKLKVASGGQQAIEYLAGHKDFADRTRFPLPFLVLLDLRMPGLDGFDVLRWIRAQPDLKRLLVVVLTSSDQQCDIDKAYELGANSYLLKPVAFEGTLGLVQRFEAYWNEINRTPTVIHTPRAVPAEPSAK
jgi:CheY-like chemotaxis protein